MATIKVLLVEDHTQYATLIQEKLAGAFDFEVSLAADPNAAHVQLQANRYDVIVVDVLYRALSEGYNARREAARSSLTELEPYNLSGLTTLYEASRLSSVPAVVIWTSGDPNRTLHLVLAHQEFGVRAFCSKETQYQEVGRAIRSAAERREFVDIGLAPFLPRRNLPPISRVLFRERRWRAIWRALAAGSPGHDITARMTNYEEQTIRKSMAPMADELAVLHPNMALTKRPLGLLSSYAVFHWEFFLDQAVHRLFPH